MKITHGENGISSTFGTINYGWNIEILTVWTSSKMSLASVAQIYSQGSTTESFLMNSKDLVGFCSIKSFFKD